jgi:hypothetical protein
MAASFGRLRGAGLGNGSWRLPDSSPICRDFRLVLGFAKLMAVNRLSLPPEA